jgi:flagellar hook-associated protein 1 FlgK
MPGFPVAIPSGTTSLSDIAAAIDGAGGSVRAKVVRNGSDGWRLSVFDARGVPIDASFAGGSVGGSSMEDFVGMSRTERISASVVTEGSGQRLRISGNAGGGIDIAAGWNSSTPPQSLITDLGLAPSVVGAASGLVLRDDIAENPSAASRRTVLTDTASGRRYLSSGDGSGMAALAAAMATSRPTPESGGLAVGATTLTGYAATIVSAAASDAAAAERNASYQNALGESLDQRLSSASGVNIDEEAADMMRFQQAYNAAARIVVVLQDMMKTLTDMIK